MAAGFAGGCLCGAVRFACSADPAMVGHCHCIDCRKSSGTGHCTHVVVPRAAFAVTGRLTTYARPADSGNLVTRAFCPTCGSPIYSTNAAMPDLVFPRASSLDDPEAIKPQMVVYASRAPSWDVVDPALPSFATMPAPGEVAAAMAQAR
ncbi:MAG: GFA family protein [Alphaproteobacteria bacterium]|nr:GFA family protein [Alphaproteobacteria bacterium]